MLDHQRRGAALRLVARKTRISGHSIANRRSAAKHVELAPIAFANPLWICRHENRPWAQAFIRRTIASIVRKSGVRQCVTTVCNWLHPDLPRSETSLCQRNFTTRSPVVLPQSENQASPFVCFPVPRLRSTRKSSASTFLVSFLS